MSRKCELSGVGVLFGNNVSHSQRKTRKKFQPNLKSVSLHSETLQNHYRFRITTRCLRTIEKAGGLDDYILKASDSLLSSNALYLKKLIKAKCNGKQTNTSTAIIS